MKTMLTPLLLPEIEIRRRDHDGGGRTPKTGRGPAEYRTDRIARRRNRRPQ